MKEIINYFKHNNGTILKGFDEAESYLVENDFDTMFEEVTKEDYEEYIKNSKEQIS